MLLEGIFITHLKEKHLSISSGLRHNKILNSCSHDREAYTITEQEVWSVHLTRADLSVRRLSIQQGPDAPVTLQPGARHKDITGCLDCIECGNKCLNGQYVIGHQGVRAGHQVTGHQTV